MTEMKQIQQRLNQQIEAQHLLHAFLFVGEQGTGKTETALWLAKRLFCLEVENGEPCGRCRNCLRISQNEFPDVIQVQPEGKGIKTQQIQLIQQEFSKSALESDQKVFIIHEADTMNESASNRLLKFIEEPPGPMLAILIATNESSILPTIRSRCQILRFTRPRLQVENERDRLLYQLTSDQSQVEQLREDEAFLNQQKLIDEWWQLLVKRDWLAFVFVQQKLLKEFTVRAQSFDDRQAKQQLFDIMMIKAKQELVTTGDLFYDHLFQQAIEAKRKLEANVNFQSVCEQFAWRVIN